MNQHLLTEAQSTDELLRKESREFAENKIPACPEFGSKAPQQGHTSLCVCLRNARAKQEDPKDGIFFDRNRLSKTQDNVAAAKSWFIPKSMFARAVFLMFLMAGYLGAYWSFGLVGLLLFALLMLLALSHPFWLMGYEVQKNK